MSSNWPKAGPNYVPAYQASGIPYVTTSVNNEVQCVDANGASSKPIQVNFPFVTRFFTIRNTGKNGLRVGFTQNGVFAPGDRLPVAGTKPLKEGRNYFVIPTSSIANGANWSESIQTFEIRCKSLFFMSDHASQNTPAVAHASSFALIAGLTTIPSSEFPVLTGSISSGSDHVIAFQGVG